jgi:hypothetical protein
MTPLQGKEMFYLLDCSQAALKRSTAVSGERLAGGAGGASGGGSPPGWRARRDRCASNGRDGRGAATKSTGCGDSWPGRAARRGRCEATDVTCGGRAADSTRSRAPRTRGDHAGRRSRERWLARESDRLALSLVRPSNESDARAEKSDARASTTVLKMRSKRRSITFTVPYMRSK